MLFFLFSIKSREFSTNFPMLHRFSNYFFFYPWEWDDFPVDLFSRHVRSFIYSFIFSNCLIFEEKNNQTFLLQLRIYRRPFAILCLTQVYSVCFISRQQLEEVSSMQDTTYFSLTLGQKLIGPHKIEQRIPASWGIKMRFTIPEIVTYQSPNEHIYYLF